MSSLVSNNDLSNSKNSNESSSFIDPNCIANQSRCATAPTKQLNGDEEFKYGIQFINLEKSSMCFF
jgi:hypothetical protein